MVNEILRVVGTERDFRDSLEGYKCVFKKNDYPRKWKREKLVLIPKHSDTDGKKIPVNRHVKYN